MFGYLQIDKAELKVREYEAYKAVYCGLCKQLGKDYSFLTRLSLSYDCTFYTMMLMSLSAGCTGFSNGRCRFNPLKKCQFADCKNDCYSKAAALSVITVYYKLLDELMDSGFWKRLLVHIIKPFFSHWRQKAARRYPEMDTIVADMLDAQVKVEAEPSPSLDATAHPTADMLGKLLCLEAKDELQKRVFYECGYHLGRWIYFIDAADDYEKDVKSNSFNPFRLIESDNPKQRMEQTLNQSLARSYDAYILIDNLTDFKGILDNMMLLGFPLKQNSVLSKRQEVTNEQSV